MNELKIGDRVKLNLEESLKTGLVNQFTEAQDPATGVIVQVLWAQEKVEWINHKNLVKC